MPLRLPATAPRPRCPAGHCPSKGCVVGGTEFPGLLHLQEAHLASPPAAKMASALLVDSLLGECSRVFIGVEAKDAEAPLGQRHDMPARPTGRHKDSRPALRASSSSSGISRASRFFQLMSPRHRMQRS